MLSQGAATFPSHQQATQFPLGRACLLPLCQAVGRGGMWQAGSCLLTGPPLSLPLQEIGSIIGKVRFGVRGTARPRLP